MIFFFLQAFSTSFADAFATGSGATVRDEYETTKPKRKKKKKPRPEL
ncbi:MAG: hypothetical protein LBS42_04075 [Tannerella sp.]|jgi:hypothetical protein|nr:hypothetical protein [Tannerella sp.]